MSGPSTMDESGIGKSTDDDGEGMVGEGVRRVECSNSKGFFKPNKRSAMDGEVDKDECSSKVVIEVDKCSFKVERRVEVAVDKMDNCSFSLEIGVEITVDKNVFSIEVVVVSNGSSKVVEEEARGEG